MVLFATVNMNLGIDFKGGSLIEVQAKDETPPISAISARLSALNLGDVQVQGFGSEKDVLIRVEEQGGGENAEQTSSPRCAANSNRITTSAASRLSGRRCRANWRAPARSPCTRGAVCDPGLYLAAFRMAVRHRRDHRDHA
jgi:preprotein translocase subunit SecD